MWFIDYANAIAGELNEYEMYPIFLRRHREVIIEGANNSKNNNAILSKFVWMAKYHNQIVNNRDEDEWKHFKVNKDDFIITSQEIPTLQYLNHNN